MGNRAGERSLTPPDTYREGTAMFWEIVFWVLLGIAAICALLAMLDRTEEVRRPNRLLAASLAFTGLAVMVLSIFDLARL